MPGPKLKVELYRRLGRVRSLERLADFRQELLDRFGAPPRPAENLLAEAELRMLAERWALTRIHVEDEYAVLTYRSARRIEKLAKLRPGMIRVVDERTAYVPLGVEEKRPHGSIVAPIVKALLEATDTPAPPILAPAPPSVPAIPAHSAPPPARPRPRCATGCALGKPTSKPSSSFEKAIAMHWTTLALLSALFAGLTAVLAKVGVASVPSNVATLVRTVVVVVFAAGIVAARGELGQVRAISPKAWVFLVLSGVATGLSWLCYFAALKAGPVSGVAPIDKLSFLIALTLGFLVLGERARPLTIVGAALIAAGVLLTLPSVQERILGG